MTREEAINNLKMISVAFVEAETKEQRKIIDDTFNMAIKAIKQEPKTVLYSGDGYADGYMVYDMAECPNCGYEYEEGDKDWGLPFCPNCGQSLNWESEEENEDSN